MALEAINILNISGEATGKTVQLPEDIFGITPNEHVLYLAVKQYLANQRQGTHKAKERSEMSGSTRKLIKQKGSGGARHGDINSPTMVGGGRAHGPRPRDYTQKMNKKVKTLARKSALAARAQAGQVIVVEDFSFDAPKTRNYVAFLSAIQAGRKPLLLTAAVDHSVLLASRNLPYGSTTTALNFNVYEVMHSDCLIVTESALHKLTEVFEQN